MVLRVVRSGMWGGLNLCWAVGNLGICVLLDGYAKLHLSGVAVWTRLPAKCLATVNFQMGF